MVVDPFLKPEHDYDGEWDNVRDIPVGGWDDDDDDDDVCVVMMGYSWFCEKFSKR